MGRTLTRSQTCEGSKRIELSYLIKNGYLRKGQITSGTLSWTTNGKTAGTIRIICSLKGEEYIRLIYTVVDRVVKKKKNFDYRIYLDSVPSNLGKGEILFFICPSTLKKCRVLYSAYSYDKWQSREAYEQRLYYESQICSKLKYANTRYWKVNSQIENLESKSHFHKYYKGQMTKRAMRFEILKMKRENWDLERWSLENMPHKIRIQHKNNRKSEK